MGQEMMTVAELHRRLTGGVPSEQHHSFYEAAARGFDVNGFDEVNFLATFILALYQAGEGTVVVVTSKVLEKQVLEAMRTTTRWLLRRFRGKEGPVKELTLRVKKLHLASRHLRTDEEPERWVSIGLSAKDPIPEWLRGKLWAPTTN